MVQDSRFKGLPAYGGAEGDQGSGFKVKIIFGKFLISPPLEGGDKLLPCRMAGAGEGVSKFGILLSYSPSP
jgi:hypothetical protein